MVTCYTVVEEYIPSLIPLSFSRGFFFSFTLCLHSPYFMSLLSRMVLRSEKMKRLAMKSINFLLHHLQTYPYVPPFFPIFSPPVGHSLHLWLDSTFPGQPKTFFYTPLLTDLLVLSTCFFLSSSVQSSFSLSLKQPNSQHLPFCQGVVLPFSLSLLQNVLKSRLHVPETFYPFHAISCLSPPHFAENILGIGHHRLLEPNSLFSPYLVRGLSHCTLPTTVFFNTPPAHVRLLFGVSPMCMWVSLSVSFMVFSSIVFCHLWGLKKVFFVINEETLTPEFYLLHFSAIVNPYGNFYRWLINS